QMKTPLEIVFFHEVGHYVAQQLNYKIFHTGEVHQIIIERVFPNGTEDYMGQTISKIPDGESPETPLKNLPEKIAEMIYGCYFQSLFLKEDLDKCFDYKNPTCRGSRDVSYLSSELASFGINAAVRDE